MISHEWLTLAARVLLGQRPPRRRFEFRNFSEAQVTPYAYLVKVSIELSPENDATIIRCLLA